MGQTSMTENPEITVILEKLVADGEALKRDNAELQNLLTESRSELRALTEEVQEYRAAASPVHPGLFFRTSSEDRSFVVLPSQLDSGYGFEIRISPVGSPATSSQSPDHPFTGHSTGQSPSRRRMGGIVRSVIATSLSSWYLTNLIPSIPLIPAPWKRCR
jgi:hypothetical protein